MEIFDYDNILLLPRRCVVESRRECDPSVELGGRQFRIPVVPANMKTVVNDDICARLAREGYFYIQHRFDVDSVAFARTMRDQGLFVSLSVGVKEADREEVSDVGEVLLSTPSGQVVPAKSVMAAFELPPPRPASDGTRLRRSMAMSRGGVDFPRTVRCSSDAAFQTRLRWSVGMSGSSHVTTSGPLRTVTVTVSNSASDWKIVFRS